MGGTEGFDELVTLTLSYDEDLIPEGVIEEDLVIATFDEAEELWEEIVGDAVLDVDLEGNTITVGITHASLWAVMAGGTVEPRATAVRAAGWGAVEEEVAAALTRHRPAFVDARTRVRSVEKLPSLTSLSARAHGTPAFRIRS